ncbi:MAG: hypothetical protein MZW92_61840 [Comamonadaceae bacterium]|nr:hypothetical protein [Comamonadaceae bacterium]
MSTDHAKPDHRQATQSDSQGDGTTFFGKGWVLPRPRRLAAHNPEWLGEQGPKAPKRVTYSQPLLQGLRGQRA